jgi:hypothetical protein
VHAPLMFEQSETTKLVEEVGRYLAAVDLFRELACEPTWRPELAPEPPRPSAPLAKPAPLNAELH